MSNFLNDITSNKISLEEALQRLLIIANKTNNDDLANWCNSELNGYKKYEDLPDYRKFKNRNIVYSGINGSYQVTNIPLGPGYLSEETLSKIENMGIFENIAKVEENKSIKETMYRDLTALAGEVYSNTNDGFFGVSCTSIRQQISSSFYSSIFSNVKTRIINLLCSFESAKVDIDKMDVSRSAELAIKGKNKDIYKTVVIDGAAYTFIPKTNRLFWNIFIPIICSIVSGVLVYLISNFWIK